MRYKILFTFLLAAAWVSSLPAQSLSISAEEQSLLGIDVQQVSASSSGSTGEITLRTAFAPDAEWAIKTPYSGILYRSFIQVGDRVAAGEVLMTVRSAEVASLQQDFLKADAEWKLQKAAWERDKKLKDAGSVSSRRWQETQFAYEMARAEFAGLKAQLAFAGYSEKDIAALSKTGAVTPDIVLRAPADALVVERPAVLGDHLDGAELLARLGDPDRLVLVGRLSRSAAAHLHQGATVRQRDSGLVATLVYVANVIDPETQTVYVRAEAEDTNGLLPGQLTTWSVLSQGEMITVPSSAIVKLDGADVAYVQVPGGFEPRQVEVKNTGAGDWIVLDGLVDGDRVAVSGTVVLKGMSVGMGGGDG